LRTRAATLVAATLLAGCTQVGPNFTAPPPPVSPGWESRSLTQVPEAPAQGPWWQAFRDPALDALIANGLAGNPDFRIAGLRVLEARALQAAARAGRLPQSNVASAGLGYGADVPAGTPLGRGDSVIGAFGASVTWELDLWGRFARAIEGADAAYFASLATRDDIALILRAEIARTYLTHRTLQEQLEALHENAALQERSVAITEVLFRQGDASELDYQQARTQLLATRAAMPPVEANIQSTANALALLIGRPPGPLPELALSQSRLPKLPDAFQSDVPADWLRLRPDVRAAFFAAAAQSAKIGIAEADLYPALALTGTVDVTRTSLGNPYGATGFFVGPTIRWNFIDFGRIRNLVRAEDARFEQALEVYRRTALSAATEVDSAAITLAKAREEVLVLAESVAAARRSLALAQLLFREGLSDFQRVLDAQAALVRQQEQLIRTRGDAAGAYVALAKALGGGFIPLDDMELVTPEARARMTESVNWGPLLDSAAEPPK
jgi:NodT family efflux transporter outer membrane factor (OMF) lipoprotein